MITRRERETQREYVERVLRTEGEIATYDALYNLAYDDGRKCSITRLAAIVWTLRDEGWEIETRGDSGATSLYCLVRAPALAVPVRAPIRTIQPPVPEWARGWRCADCGGRPAAEPQSLLGDLGRAPCSACGATRYFRRAA